MKVHTYRIHGKAEEFECERCACPLYNGDRAVHVEDDRFEAYVCSATCGAAALADKAVEVADMKANYTQWISSL